MKLRDILAQLEYIYAGNVGAEFAHVSDSEERLWLQDEFQEGRLRHASAAEERRNILWQLTAAEGLERYLHTKYVGQKRFSLEGRRRVHSAARRSHSAAPAPTASRKWSSAWRTAAASTCW